VTVAGPKTAPSGLAAVVRSALRPGPRADATDAAGPVAAIASLRIPPDAWVVAADGDDVDAIVEAVGPAALAPGSLRWLADREDEAARPVSP
jgi:hypothetical protein